MAGNIYHHSPDDYSQPPREDDPEEQQDRYTSTPTANINEVRHEYDPLRYDELDEPEIRFTHGNAMVGRPLPEERKYIIHPHSHYE